MFGLGCRRFMRLPTITTSSTPTIPLGTENNPNNRVSSTVIEASKNVPVVLESNVEEFEANTLALGVTSKKGGRGLNRGVQLAKQLEKKGGKLDILIPDGINRPVGENNTKLPRKIGYLVRTIATMQVADWSGVEDQQKKKIIKTLLGCGDIDLYKAEFTNKNGDWVDKKHEDKYKKMKFDLDQAIENGDPVNEAAICAKHLGTTSGYIRGKGRGPKPPKKVRSSSATILPSTMDEQMQEELTKAKGELTQATEKLDETGEELAATKKKLNRQEKMSDWMKDIVIEKFGMTLPTLCSDDESGDDS
ncbi:hypothetical protein ACH5RR_018220 [Cinchona calisaya]|uniref:Uncharacterized protein n=1 Tax=Cinchona calisaya TaxID=153742 RepID=A0ABD2ZKT8_9GENT